MRAAAGSALRAGFSPWCADLFGDADLVTNCPARLIEHYPYDLPRLLHVAPSGPWMYTGAIENYPRVVAEIAAERELWGVDSAALRQVRDPWQVAAALKRRQLVAPALAGTPADLPTDGSWLRKRYRSAGGQHIAPWHGDSASSRMACYFQQFIPGASCSAVFVAATERACLLGATRQLIGEPWTGADGFRYAGSIGPLRLSKQAETQLADIGDALSAKFGLVGLFGVDFILRDEQVWPVEVNPRYTASVEILERATGLRSIHWHAEACRYAHLPEPSANPLVAEIRHGKAILFAHETLEIAPETTAALLAMNDGPRWPQIADIPRAGSRIEPGWPVATVFASGITEVDVVAELRERIASLSALLGLPARAR